MLEATLDTYYPPKKKVRTNTHVPVTAAPWRSRIRCSTLDAMWIVLFVVGLHQVSHLQLECVNARPVVHQVLLDGQTIWHCNANLEVWHGYFIGTVLQILHHAFKAWKPWQLERSTSAHRVSFLANHRRTIGSVSVAVACSWACPLLAWNPKKHWGIKHAQELWATIQFPQMKHYKRPAPTPNSHTVLLPTVPWHMMLASHRSPTDQSPHWMCPHPSGSANQMWPSQRCSSHQGAAG